MKIYLKPLALYFFILALGFGNTSYSQENKSIFKSSLWLMGNDKKNTENKTDFSKEEKQNNYFNYNPVVDFSNQTVLNNYQNIVKKKSSLFLVFKSSSDNETNLLSIERGTFEANINNKKIVCNKEVYLNKGDSKKGILLSYLFNKNALLEKKDGSLILDSNSFGNNASENQLIELVYIPKVVSTNEKNILESYLSIKYGISLYNDQNYYNSKKDTIWSKKKNEGFNTRVTGIGKDDLLGLNQKQSGNSQKDGLSIGINSIEKTNNENKSTLKDRTYLLWGDNNEDYLLEKDNSSTEKRMKRVWKTKIHSSESNTLLKTQIQIDKKLMILDESEKSDQNYVTWLAIDSTATSKFNYANAKYIKATINNAEKIVFDNVSFSKNNDYLFTIVQAPDFFVSKSIETPNCFLSQNGKLNLSMNGGSAPYKIHITSTTFDKELHSDSDQLKVENLESGKYNLEVIDINKKVLNTNFDIDSIHEDAISLSPKWSLSEDETVKIVPKATDAITSFFWLFNGKMISNEKEFTARNTGNYTLKVSNKLGCQKEFSFEVVNKLGEHNYGYVIYPNPVAHTENFTVQFNLKEPSKVFMKIADMNGKIIKSKSLGTIEKHQFKENLPVTGNYLIQVSINDVVETNKLIVK